MSVSIEGKWALVTGASRGVGKLVATALSEQGCKIILHSRRIEGTKEVLQAIKEKGNEAFAVAAELSNINQVQQMISVVKKLTGNHLDILYNNAAIMTPYHEEYYETPADDFSLSFLVNSTIPAILSNAFLPGMLKNKWGRIVNVTSGIANEPQLMAYSCSKAALDRYVRDLVPFLDGSGVLMNLMDPGWLSTDLGGPNAPNDPGSVLPGALVPVLLEVTAGSGKLYHAQDYAK